VDFTGEAAVTRGGSGLRSVRRRALARFSLAAAGDALRCLDGRLRSFDWVEPLRFTARAAHARAAPATVLRPRSTAVGLSAVAPVPRPRPATRWTGRGRLTAARDLPRLFGTNTPVAASAPRMRPVPGHNLPRRMCLVIQGGYARVHVDDVLA